MVSTGLLTVDLAAIQKNWLLLHQKVDASSECAAVVKANAYGLGAAAVTQALLDVGCHRFFVATLSEAIELREAVKGDYNIVVLGGMASSYFKECVHYQINPTLVTLGQLSLWSKARGAFTDSDEKCPSPLIKVDTGMHRLGLSLDEISELISNKNLLRTLAPSVLMSHLACADEPDHPLNSEQRDAFCSVFKRLKQFLPEAKASFANSSGIFLGEGYWFDIVRPGVSLYGANPTPKLGNPMTPVVELAVPINQLKDIPAGDSVGYGATYKAKKNMRIAITFGGYADGLFRLLSNRGHAFFRGYSLPIVGRVSMDSIAFDVSSVPEALFRQENNMIEILGEHQGVDQLAAQASTIAYEVLTSLGQRYQRTYRSSC